MSWREVLQAIPITFLPCDAAGNAAPGLSAAAAGAAPAYPCCPDCGVREPCDEHCPRAAELPILMRADLTYGGLAAGRFQLDEAALMSEIEPVPAFLTRRTTAEEIEQLLELARADQWPKPPALRRAG